jgi:putative endonuclease
MKRYFVYILASKRYGTLYIGITSNLSKRIFQHQVKELEGFTSKYNVVHLVHIEEYMDVITAISREKQLKRWRRQYKIDLIDKNNFEWSDLSENLL